MPKHSYNKKSIRKHGTTAWKAEFDEEKQRLELTEKCFLVNRECLDFDKNNKRFVDEGTCQTVKLYILKYLV